MLKNYPEIRKIAYIVSTILGIALGALQVGFASANAGQPVWLTVALAVYAFIGGALGIQAATNTTTPGITELTDNKGGVGDE
jgi:hypothetical protein